MGNSDRILEILAELQETGLADVPGKLLYSGVGTLCRGRIYLLGWNPGGDPDVETDTTKVDFLRVTQRDPHWNEYLDASWRPRGRICAPGRAPMQARTCSLVEGIGLQIRAVCATNVIFVRSRVSEGLEKPSKLADKCWPVHQKILDIVQPAGILTIGGDAFKFVLSRGRALTTPEVISAGQGNLVCRVVQALIGNCTVAIVSVPHLGERLHYEPEMHPKVVGWVREKLGM